MADDDRPQYQHGVGTIGGTQFHWGSGTPGKYWSIPYGDYPVTPNAPTGAWAQQAGAIPIANNVIPDPQLGRNRIGIMIHSGSAPDLDTLYTQGCFKVDPQDWPNVRSQILAEADKGPLYLHVAPGGVAAFTNTKTFSQAGDETPAANANAAANTTAATQPSRPATGAPAPPSDFLTALQRYESGGKNIPNTTQGTSSGQAQGYNQITTGTWNEFGGTAYAPDPLHATLDQQNAIAAKIPMGRWDPKTLAYLQGQGFKVDPKQTLGENIAMNSGGGSTTPGTTINSTPVAGGAPALPGMAPAQSSQLTQGMSGFQKAMAGGQSQDGGGGEDPMRPSPMLQGPAPHIPNAQAAAQTFGQTLNSMRTPLQWGSGTPGSSISTTAGPQVAAGMPQGMTAQELQQLQMMQMMGGMGTSLNSFGGGYG